MIKIIVIAGLFLAAVAGGLLTGPGGLSYEIMQLRVARVILAVFAGGILAFCGAVMQGLFGNPLVEPYTLGAASGAALGSAAGLLIFNTISPVFAFLGALGSSFAVFSVARIEGGLMRDRLILAGVVISFMCSSLVMIIMIIGSRELYEVLYLLMGYLGVVINTSNRLLVIGVVAIAAVLVAYLFRYHREFDIVSQGAETAAGMGIDLQRFSITVFFLVSLLVGLVVSVVGAIGFVGLIVPHIARLLFGPGHLKTLPASLVLGAAFLLLADILARTISIYDLPVGIITSLIGVPFFIYLYRR